MPTILIADDHPLFRKALRGILRMAYRDVEVVETSTLAEAKAAVRADLDLMLLDLSMPDASGFSALIALRNLAPSVPIVIVSAQADVETVRQSATYGAAGFIPKTADPPVIAHAVTTVLSGKRWWPLATAQDSARPAAPSPEGDERIKRLSTAEARVLELMGEGKANKQIAFDLGIKESTVKSHVTALLRKLEVFSRTQAVLLAKQLGRY